MRKMKKFKEYFNSNDDLLMGITFQDLIDAVYSNESTVDEKTVMRVFDEMLRTNVSDAKFILKKNMQQILGELR